MPKKEDGRVFVHMEYLDSSLNFEMRALPDG